MPDDRTYGGESFSVEWDGTQDCQETCGSLVSPTLVRKVDFVQMTASIHETLDGVPYKPRGRSVHRQTLTL